MSTVSQAQLYTQIQDETLRIAYAETFQRSTLENAASVVYEFFGPTPQQQWPLLSNRVGVPVWVKHENHTPVGAFKVRGGLVYLAQLMKAQPQVNSLITATRGNHGQSIAFAAQRYHLPVTIVVPEGNSADKNASMRALGATVIEYGDDFQVAIDHAKSLAQATEAHFVPSFHPWLVQGVASYSLELLKGVPDLETLYVSIGMGSGICGAIAAKAVLNHPVNIVGVVSEGAPAYYHSFYSRTLQGTPTAETMADGIACRTPHPDAFKMILDGVDRVVKVSDSEILQAMAVYYSDTHNIAEGAGAAPLAALLQEGTPQVRGAVGVILSGGNVDASLYQQALMWGPSR